MKRVISLLLAAVLLVLPFALCGCNKESEGESQENASSETEESYPMIIIDNDPNYTNVTLGKSYEVTGLYPDAASPSYPDEEGKSLTDGTRPTDTAKYSDKTFVGFNKNASSYVSDGYASVKVDLGGLYYLDKFVASVGSRYHIDVGIDAPEFVAIYLSNDGKEWYNAGVAQSVDNASKSTVEVTLELEGALTARYIDFRFIGNGNWIMVAEAEAFGIPAEEALAYPTTDTPLSFLFIGNSSTYFFNIPHKFQQICKAAGINVDVEYCCIGGAYLREYADASNERHGKLLRDKLNKKSYDYVVVQDNSNADYPESKPAMDIIVPLIEENGAKLLIYERYSSNDDPTQRLDSAYRHHVNYGKLADDFGVEKIAHGADAFLICDEKYPNEVIYHTDNSHHSHAGAFLIATVWAMTYLDIDVSNNSYTAGLDADTVAALRECARLACEEGYDYPQDN